MSRRQLRSEDGRERWGAGCVYSTPEEKSLNGFLYSCVLDYKQNCAGNRGRDRVPGLCGGDDR